MSTRVLADANVLFSRTLRDWLILIQINDGPYIVYYSEDILAEVVYHLRRASPAASGRTITRIRDRIADSLEGGRVDDFVVDGTFTGDVNDQHVHAAAVACQAEIVLTSDGGSQRRASSRTRPTWSISLMSSSCSPMTPPHTSSAAWQVYQHDADSHG